jgi:prolyl 4-hydroxylase
VLTYDLLTLVRSRHGACLIPIQSVYSIFTESHHDYIDFEVTRQSGVRLLTVFLYLNNVTLGGETDFPRLHLKVTPRVGRALLWPSVLDHDPNAPDWRTEHQALPVKEGIKYGANVWLHQRKNDCDD